MQSLRDRFHRSDLRRRFGGDGATVTRPYDLLVGPLRNRLDAESLLVVVPDETTYGIAFAALKNPEGKFLAERIGDRDRTNRRSDPAEQLTLAPGDPK